jgi:hypothetical protein
MVPIWEQFIERGYAEETRGSSSDGSKRSGQTYRMKNVLALGQNDIRSRMERFEANAALPDKLLRCSNLFDFDL